MVKSIVLLGLTRSLLINKTQSSVASVGEIFVGRKGTAVYHVRLITLFTAVTSTLPARPGGAARASVQVNRLNSANSFVLCVGRLSTRGASNGQGFGSHDAS
jgi:hypothetical protein